MKNKDKDYSLDETLIFISHYLQSPENIITNIVPLDCYNDYPKFYQYVTQYQPINDREDVDLIANGLSFDRKEAFLKAIMETIERWYLASCNGKKFIKGSYSQLKKKRLPVLDPKSFTPFSKKQLLSKKLSHFFVKDKHVLFWTKVKSLFDNKTFYIPAQLIYLMLTKQYHEPTIRISDSSGAAAGTSISQALYKAICELVERDAFAITYYNMLSVEKLSIQDISDDNIQNLATYLLRYCLKPIIYDITMDIKIPTFLCVLVNQASIGPALTVGVKCDLSWQEALYGAILESLQAITTLRDILTLKKSFQQEKRFQKMLVFDRPILKRLLYWTSPESKSKIDFLLNSPTQPVKYNNPPYKNFTFREKLKTVLKLLQEAKLSIYWKLFSPRKLSRFNLYAVKVIIPELVPLSLFEDYPYFGVERLFKIPKKLGYNKFAKDENQLNPVAHPLP